MVVVSTVLVNVNLVCCRVHCVWINGQDVCGARGGGDAMPAYNYSILLNVPVPSSTARRLVATVIAKLLKQLASQYWAILGVAGSCLHLHWDAASGF